MNVGTILRVIPIIALAFATAAPVAAQVQTKTYTWGQMSSGDCVMVAGSTLSLNSDGTGRFTATTFTWHTHNQDVWHHNIEVIATNGAPMFNLGQWDSPGMHDGPPPPQYGWSVPFVFDPAQFNAIGSAIAHNYSC